MKPGGTLTFSWRTSWTLAVALAVAVLAGVITLRFRDRVPGDAHQTGPAVMEALRAFRPAGWQVAELPLGPNEVSEQLVSRILRFDDAVFLRFHGSGREFSVYVAYWRPGKADLRSVNAHTPDTCWLNSGWRTADKSSGFTGFSAEAALPPGEYRCYANEGTQQYVAFWHLLAGQPVRMWRNGFPTFDFMWSIFRGDRQRLDGEQYFIRISSPESLKTLWADPALQGALQRLAEAGLTRDAVR